MRRSTSIAVTALAATVPLASCAPSPFESLYRATSQLTFGLSSPSHPVAAPESHSAIEAVADQLRSIVGSAEATTGRWASQVCKEAEALVDEMSTVVDGTLQALAYGKKQAAKAVQPPAIVVDDVTSFDIVSSPLFPQHVMRVKSPQTLCDPSVKQHSGYLDISDAKHIFFWFFESRSNPKKDPLVAWFNGGPGCSSSTGLLMELGPCNAVANGSTEYNKHGWNSEANIVFIDQPVGVGYSYSDDGSSINNSADAAADIYVFFQLLYQKFPELGKLPLTIAAESYGGHYAPAFAHRIWKENEALKSGMFAANRFKPSAIPLSTVMIGNGLTSPLEQFASVPDYGCEPSKYTVFDDATCESLRSKVPTCQRLQKYCYDSPSRFTCVPATFYCWSSLYGPFQNLGLNPYNIKEKCDRNKNPLCYEEMNYIETYLNKPEVKKELGVPSSLNFEACNMEVNRAFQVNGDNMHNSAALLPELLESGIRLLVYAGELDFMCNYLGNEDWMLVLDTPFTAEFANASYPYESSFTKKAAGTVRSGGDGAYSYVSLLNAGHMVPHDQPEVALELLNRWLHNKPLISS